MRHIQTEINIDDLIDRFGVALCLIGEVLKIVLHVRTLKGIVDTTLRLRSTSCAYAKMEAHIVTAAKVRYLGQFFHVSKIYITYHSKKV